MRERQRVGLDFSAVLRTGTEGFCDRFCRRGGDNRLFGEGGERLHLLPPREVYSQAVVRHAAAIIAFHNHPSGDPYPSSEDRKLTEALDKAGEVLGIPLMDHIVIGDGTYYSFKEHGDL